MSSYICDTVRLVVCEEAIARRHGDMAPRLGQSGGYTASEARAPYPITP